MERIVDLDQISADCTDPKIVTLRMLQRIHGDEAHRFWRITHSDGGAWNYEKLTGPHTLVARSGETAMCGGPGACSMCDSWRPTCPIDGDPCYPNACCAPVAGHPESIPPDRIDALVDWQLSRRPPEWLVCPRCRTGWQNDGGSQPEPCPHCGTLAMPGHREPGQPARPVFPAATNSAADSERTKCQ